MTKEYIDREALIADMKNRYCTGCNSYDGVRCRACLFDDAIGEIDDAPAADVVEVVRCKDCKHEDPNGCGENFTWCDFLNIGVVGRNEHFCSFGERREEG